MGTVAAVGPEAWLNVSDNSVFVVSSLPLSNYSGSTVVQNVPSLGLLGIY